MFITFIFIVLCQAGVSGRSINIPKLLQLFQMTVQEDLLNNPPHVHIYSHG